MARRFVSQLAHQEAVDQVFLASEKQLRPNRNGNLYLQVDLSDRSGSISARMWNASESDLSRRSKMATTSGSKARRNSSRARSN